MAARLAQCVRGLSAPKTLDMAVRNMRIYSKQPFYSVVRRRHRRRRRQVVLAVGAAAAAASWLTYNYISCIEVACDAPRGRVYLVGAGPGAADLLTLRAAKLLSQADVVVCDELIGNDVLSSCRKDATIMTMGKRGGRETSTKQNDINDVIVKLCKEGKMVVRLKGGDPLLFGRAADEIRSLAKHG